MRKERRRIIYKYRKIVISGPNFLILNYFQYSAKYFIPSLESMRYEIFLNNNFRTPCVLYLAWFMKWNYFPPLWLCL